MEFEYTHIPTTLRSTSVAPPRIVNPLPHVCWTAYWESNPGWAQIGWNWMLRKHKSSGLALGSSSPRSRKQPWWSVGRFQVVLNPAARLVVGTGKFSHVIPILRDVSTGSLYSTKSATKSPYMTVFTASARPILVTFVLRWLQPPDKPTCVQRRVTIFWSNKIGRTSFRISAPTVWNPLRFSLKHSATSRETFRKELNTYLFRKASAPTSENYWRVHLLTYSTDPII